jgi:hypothetical protein
MQNSNHDYVSFRDVCRAEWIPRRPGATNRLSLPTLWRWANRGLLGVRLRYVKIGRSPYTTREWLLQFFAAVADAQRGEVVAPTVRTPARRERDIDAATAKLAGAGM